MIVSEKFYVIMVEKILDHSTGNVAEDFTIVTRYDLLHFASSILHRSKEKYTFFFYILRTELLPPFLELERID